MDKKTETKVAELRKFSEVVLGRLGNKNIPLLTNREVVNKLKEIAAKIEDQLVEKLDVIDSKP